MSPFIEPGTYDIVLILNDDFGEIRYSLLSQNIPGDITIPFGNFTPLPRIIITITGIPDEFIWDTGHLQVGATSISTYIQSSTAFFISSFIEPGIYDIVLRLYDWWSGRELRYTLSSQNISGDITIPFSNFKIPTVIITVTDIPAQYHDNWGSIALTHPEAWDNVGFRELIIPGSSAVFSIPFVEPDVYDVYLGLSDSDREFLFVLSSRTISGEDTFSFNSFTVAEF